MRWHAIGQWFRWVPRCGRFLELFGHPDQVRERFGLHLMHDVIAVNLDRLFADTEFDGDLLIEQPRHDLSHHAALAGRHTNPRRRRVTFAQDHRFLDSAAAPLCPRVMSVTPVPYTVADDLRIERLIRVGGGCTGPGCQTRQEPEKRGGEFDNAWGKAVPVSESPLRGEKD